VIQVFCQSFKEFGKGMNHEELVPVEFILLGFEEKRRWDDCVTC
jgi:hypothetical protein